MINSLETLLKDLPQEDLNLMFKRYYEEHFLDPKNIQIKEVNYLEVGGAWSIGYEVIFCIDGQDHKLFLKTERDPQMPQRLQNAEELVVQANILPLFASHSKTTNAYGVYGIVDSENNDKTSLIDDKNILLYLDVCSVIIVLQELLDLSEYKQLLSILAQAGLSTIQSRTVNGKEATLIHEQSFKEIYMQIIQELCNIHKQKKVVDTKRYASSLDHVISHRTRTKGLYQLYSSFSNVITPQEHGEYLLSKMTQLKEKYADRAQAAKRTSLVHGDLWAANIFVSLDKGKSDISIIDPSGLTYGEPAYDVVFLLSDLFLTDVNTGNMTNLTHIAEGLLDYYQVQMEDLEVRKYMGLFYAYKAFISSLFDAPNLEQDTQEIQRKKLFCSAIGVLELSLENENFEFSFNDFERYVVIGQQIFPELS